MTIDMDNMHLRATSHICFEKSVFFTCEKINHEEKLFMGNSTVSPLKERKRLSSNISEVNLISNAKSGGWRPESYLVIFVPRRVCFFTCEKINHEEKLFIGNSTVSLLKESKRLSSNILQERMSL